MAKHKNNLPDEEIEIFKEAMKNVRSLGDTNHLSHHLPPSNLSKKPICDTYMTTPPLKDISYDYLPRIMPEDSLFFARDGLQAQRIRRLKKGQIPIEARLDLHGMTLPEADTALSNFLDSCQQRKLHCVLIIHGKGNRSVPDRPTLKSGINRWLRDHPTVLAFSSAIGPDGGTGAVYVLLRKKRENR